MTTSTTSAQTAPSSFYKSGALDTEQFQTDENKTKQTAQHFVLVAEDWERIAQSVDDAILEGGICLLLEDTEVAASIALRRKECKKPLTSALPYEHEVMASKKHDIEQCIVRMTQSKNDVESGVAMPVWLHAGHGPIIKAKFAGPQLNIGGEEKAESVVTRIHVQAAGDIPQGEQEQKQFVAEELRKVLKSKCSPNDVIDLWAVRCSNDYMTALIRVRLAALDKTLVIRQGRRLV